MSRVALTTLIAPILWGEPSAPEAMQEWIQENLRRRTTRWTKEAEDEAAEDEAAADDQAGPELDAEQIDRDVNIIYRTLQKCIKYFDNHSLPKCTEVAQQIFDQVAEFRPQVPLVVALRQAGMRDRHWDDITNKTGKKVHPDAKYSLQNVFDDKLAENIDVITKISEVAGKEFAIETSLDNMEGAWQDVPLQIEAYKETGTCILKGIDEYMALLDEHITMTQAMTFSAFKGPFEERIESWNHKLFIIGEVLDKWLEARARRLDSYHGVGVGAAAARS